MLTSGEPAQHPLGKRRANHSPLMAALVKASTPSQVQACPFGCAPEDYDRHGYCAHLIGFTVPGHSRYDHTLGKTVAEKDAQYEPVEPRKRNDGTVAGWFVNGKHRRPLPEKCQLEQITVSARVYAKPGLEGWSPASAE